MKFLASRSGAVPFFILSLVFSAAAPAQEWTFHNLHAPPAQFAGSTPFVPLSAGALASVDDASLRAVLAQAPDEDSGLPPAVIALPMPWSGWALFHVVRSPIFDPALAAQLPGVETYAVRGIDDPAMRGRIDTTVFGLRGLIRTPEGAIFIDPAFRARQDAVVSYYLKDVLTAEPFDFACAFDEANPNITAPSPAELGAAADATFTTRGSTPLKTYRFAIACTGEYGVDMANLVGLPPSAAVSMSALVTVTNRSNVTFEADLGVRFVLVPNNINLAFFDPATDPYPDPNPACIADPAANCSGAYLSANPGVINGIIGSANYDVGHVMTRVRGGVASLNSACGSSSSKARGVSGIPRGGDIDPLSALVLVHELGHQFGALHTFNGVLGRCGGNHTPGSNWEPGGGSTQMAYPGACPVGGGISGDNLVIFADPYFHTGSILQMRNSFINNNTASCAGSNTSTNAAPALSSITPSNLAIPRSTPFFLSAVASDADNDPLTYQWDQLDIGPAISLATPDNGESALFRSFPETPSGTRTFPKWADILSNTATPGEALPTFPNVQRKFRVTVRDRALNGSGITISPIVTLNIADAGPFAITGPAPGSTNNQTVTVTWSVAGTTAAPVSAAAVDIRLTTDDGQTYVPLATNTANDGSETLSLPARPLGTNTRVLVAPTNNIFFALSQPFTAVPPCDSIDFNNDSVSPDTQDIADLLAVFAGATCPGAACNDIDFNNDGVSPDTEDVNAFIRVFGGGAC